MKRAGGVPKIIKPQAFRAGAPERNPRTGAPGQNPRAGTSLTRRAPLQELPEASERPAGAERPQRPAPIEGIKLLSQPEPPEKVKRSETPRELPAETTERQASQKTLEEAERPESPQEPSAETTEPQALQEPSEEEERPHRPSPGAARPSLAEVEEPPSLQSTPEPPGAPPAENGSVYFIPYKYYLMSETMAFSGTAGWKNSQRYQEFLRVTRGKISGSGYDETEAAVVCQIFKRDMQLMFYEKAIQEIRERGFGLTQAQKDSGYAEYSKRLHDEKSAFAKRKTLPPPPDFNQDALWFASFSSDQAPCLPSRGEHAGSIYFDGGRIRLMHVHGPALKRGTPARTLGGKDILKKPKKEKAREDLETLVQQARREGRPTTLIEFGTGGKHTSRGYPKIVDLIDEDIAQLYYLADRISTVLSGDEDWELRSQGFSYISQERKISAGNKLMAEFIGGHARLKAALGYG